MKRKIIPIILTICVIASLVGCTSNKAVKISSSSTTAKSTKQYEEKEDEYDAYKKGKLPCPVKIDEIQIVDEKFYLTGEDTMHWNIKLKNLSKDYAIKDILYETTVNNVSSTLSYCNTILPNTTSSETEDEIYSCKSLKKEDIHFNKLDYTAVRLSDKKEFLIEYDYSTKKYDVSLLSK